MTPHLSLSRLLPVSVEGLSRPQTESQQASLSHLIHLAMAWSSQSFLCLEILSFSLNSIYFRSLHKAVDRGSVVSQEFLQHRRAPLLGNWTHGLVSPSLWERVIFVLTHFLRRQPSFSRQLLYGRPFGSSRECRT